MNQKLTILLFISFYHFQSAVGQHFERLDASWFAGQSRNSNSCAWGDADGDGDLDLFVTNGHQTQENEFYENLGDGRMILRPDILQKLDALPSFGAAWGDYDRDGDLDLYVNNAIYQTEDAAPNFLYRNDGNLQFTPITDVPIAADLTRSYAAAWVDLDNDGDLDLSVFNAYGNQNRLYLNDGESHLSYYDGEDFSEIRHGTTSGSWSDFDNDGDADCLAMDTWNYNILLYLNRGTGAMEQLLPGENTLADSEIYSDRSACWADVNKDGWQDVLIRRLEGGPLLFINDGDGDFSQDFPFMNSADVDPEYYPAQAAIWGDFDADGDLDLQLPISYQMRHEFYRNDGSGQLNMETDVVSIDKRALSYGMAAIDYDLNGDLDFFLCIRFDVEPGETSGKAAPNQLYVASESTCNESIQMELRGSTSNTFGVGAKVWVYFTDETGQANGQMQEVVCLNSGGYSGQNGYRLYFGLGAATEADSIVVNWPSGYRQVIGPTNAGHLYYIHEDGNVELKKPFARLKISAEVNPDNTCQVVALSASGNRGRVTWVDADTGEQISEELRLLIKPEDEGRTFQATDFCGRTTSYTIPYKGVTIEMGPNPTSGQLFLKMNSTNQEETTFKAEVTNVLGQYLGFYEWEVAGGYQEEVLDLSSFPSGTYYVQFDLDCRKLSEEIILVRD